MDNFKEKDHFDKAECFDKTECFICFLSEENETFLGSKICKCTGTLKIHESCYLQLREYDDICKICKTKYPRLCPKFINGYAKIKNFADETSPFDVFYTIDSNHKKQGIETWFEDKVIKYEIPYINGIKHGLEKHYEYGSICSIIPYEYGKIHGVVLGYKIDRSQVDTNGNFVSILYSSTNYENGIIIKDSKKFYTTDIKDNRNINISNTFL
jgi:hypothetical protein